jgi:hypothetical protein
MSDYYQDVNVTTTETHVSPSGNYKLVIKTYKTSVITKKSTWDYTQGFVYTKDDIIIGTIKRNYSEFPFCFFVHDKVEYLVSGRSYMRQTIINCQTGEIYDNSTDDTASDFCWSSIYQLDNNTLCAYGCFWGGGYDLKFFDISNLSEGWPELQLDDIITNNHYDTPDSLVDFKVVDNVLIVKSSDWDDNDENEEEDEENKTYDLVVKMKRENNVIVVCDEVIKSDKQKTKEEEWRLRKKEENERLEIFRGPNVFYQQLIKQLDNLILKHFTYPYTHKFMIQINATKQHCCIEYTQHSEVTLSYSSSAKIYKTTFYPQDVSVIPDIIEQVKDYLYGG